MDGFELDLTLKHYLVFATGLLLLSLIGWTIAYILNKRSKLSFSVSAAIGATIVTMIFVAFLVFMAK